MMDIFIAGHAETKGSTKAFRCGNRCIITNANPRCKKWQQRVTLAVINAKAEKTEGAVSVEMTFVFLAAKSRKDIKEGDLHIQKPDIDKIERPVLDALTDIVYKDDCQVAKVSKRKIWTLDPSKEGLHLKIMQA